MKLTARTILALIFSGIAFNGCVAPQAQPQPTTTISCAVPTIAGLPGTNGANNAAQEKGGVEITVVPVTYQAVKKEKVTMHPIAQPFAAAILVGNQPNVVYVEQTTTPYLVVDPVRLKFTVRVNNKLSRVFRGQGAVVQFNVDGKLIPFDKAKLDYTEFLNGIVPPQNEEEFAIYGPRIDSLAGKGTIAINFYDVVTATDVAGNVTERQNYEWIFSYTTKPVEQTVEVTTTQNAMNMMQYQQEMIKQAQQTQLEMLNQPAQ